MIYNNNEHAPSFIKSLTKINTELYHSCKRTCFTLKVQLEPLVISNYLNLKLFFANYTL